MAKIHGKNFAVYVAGVKVGDATNCVLTVNQEIIDTENSNDDIDEGNWQGHIVGIRSWSVSVDYLEDSSNSFSAEDAIDLILDATEALVEFSQAAESTVYWFGQAHVDTTNLNAPKGAVNGSLNFIGNGELEKATISAS